MAYALVLPGEGLLLSSHEPLRAASVHSDLTVLPYSSANNTENYQDGIKGRNEVFYTQLVPRCVSLVS